jgi:hypothetical protein
MSLRKFSNGKTDRWSIAGDTVSMNEYMTKEQDSDEMDLIKWNVFAGISEPIDPFLEILGNEEMNPFYWETFPAASPAMLAIAVLLGSSERPEIEIDWPQLDQTPEAVKFQISHNWVDCFNPGFAYELARITVPGNEAGLITSLETELTFEDPSYSWPRGDSSYHKRLLDATPGSEVGDLHVQWCIKIEGLQLNPMMDSLFRIVSSVGPVNWISKLPGIIHPEIGPWNENLFLLGKDHFVHLRCPANSVVSLWINYYPTLVATGVWAAGGIMKAQTQVQESRKTFDNFARML